MARAPGGHADARFAACSAAAWRRIASGDCGFGRGRAAGDRGGADRAIGHRRGRRATRSGVALGVGTRAAVGCRRGARSRIGVVLVLWAPWRAAAPPRVTRTTITTSGPAALTINGIDRDLALSPDGTHVVYVGNNGTQLFVRALDALEPVAIASGGALRGPFVSPDGQWVGFIDDATRSRRSRSPAARRSRSPRLDGTSRGATWAPDDTIIFATSNPATGLQRVSAAGGTPEVLTRPDHAQGEADHLWPEILPGGRAVLFTITSQTGGLDTAQVAVRDLRTGTQKVLLRGGSHGHYVASGHLVYVAAGTLRAIPFDPTRLETHGTAVPVLPRLVTTRTGAGDFAVAADGTLVYVDAPGSLAANARTLVWVDRTGKEEPVAAPPRAYEHPRLSPDGTRVALSSRDQENDLWIWDLRRATLTRLTLDPGQDWFPVWTPDGRRIIFSSNRGGQLNLWWQAADGTGAAERLTTSSNAQFRHRDHAGWDRGRVQRSDADDGPRSAAARARRDTPGDAAAADEVRRAQRDRLARRPVAGVRVQQFGLVRNLRPALSERRRRPVASLDGGGQAAALGAERQGTVLLSVPTVRCCACRWRRAARRGTPARR